MAARASKPREADPATQVRDLEAALARGGLARAYVLRGEERYFRDRALEALRARALADGLEVRLHDAEDPDFALTRLLDDLGGAGLFAARQLVVARNVEDELQKVDQRASPLARALEAFLAADAGTAVVSAAALRADHSFVRAVAAAGGTVLTSRRLYDSPPPWGNPDPRRAELVLWLGERARELGVRLGPDQAVYVAAATGNDLYALEDQLQKLRDAPAGSGLRDLVGWEASAAPWSVSEAMVAGDLARGLGGIETLFAGGFEERDGRRLVEAPALAQILLGALQGLVRRGLAVSEAIAAGAAPEDAAREAGAAGPPAAVQRDLARAQSRGAAQWRRMLEDLADVERRSKSTAGVEADDFALLALRWRDPATRAPRGGR
jgi:DNA polymerase III delta subunit